MAVPVLYVLAGVNGSGKSSIGGAVMESRGVEYYNPDTVAGKLLRLYDNSQKADPHSGETPMPQLLLHVEARKIVGPNRLPGAPEWAKPIIAGALNSYK